MSEIQESYALLMQIDKLLADIELKINNIEGKAPQIQQQLNDIKATLTIYMILLNRLNLPYGIDRTIQALIRLKMTVDMLIRAFHLLDIVSGPWGWAKAIGTFAVAGVSGYSIYESITGV